MARPSALPPATHGRALGVLGLAALAVLVLVLLVGRLILPQQRDLGGIVIVGHVAEIRVLGDVEGTYLLRNNEPGSLDAESGQFHLELNQGARDRLRLSGLSLPVGEALTGGGLEAQFALDGYDFLSVRGECAVAFAEATTREIAGHLRCDEITDLRGTATISLVGAFSAPMRQQ